MDTLRGTCIISHSSALELLRQPGTRWYLEQGRCDVPASCCWDVSTARLRAAREADGYLGSLTLPVHVMACGDTRGRNSALSIVHRHAGALPPRSLVAMGGGLFAASPELCLVQLADSREAVEALTTVMEFCGPTESPRGSPAASGWATRRCA